MNALRLTTCLISIVALSGAAIAAQKPGNARESEAVVEPASDDSATPAVVAPPPLAGPSAKLPMLTNRASAPDDVAAPPIGDAAKSGEKSTGAAARAASAPDANALKALDGQSAAGVCQYYEERVIPFTSWETPDRVSVRVVGDSCEGASVIVSIAEPKGRAIFTHAAILNQLNPRETTPGGMAKTVEGVWRIVGPRRTSDIAEWAPPKESYVAGDEMPLWGAQEHEAARHADMPLICYPQDGMSGQCVYYDAARAGVRELIRLLGPTTFGKTTGAPVKSSTKAQKTNKPSGKYD